MGWGERCNLFCTENSLQDTQSHAVLHILYFVHEFQSGQKEEILNWCRILCAHDSYPSYQYPVPQVCTAVVSGCVMRVCNFMNILGSWPVRCSLFCGIKIRYYRCCCFAIDTIYSAAALNGSDDLLNLSVLSRRLTARFSRSSHTTPLNPVVLLLRCRLQHTSYLLSHQTT